MADLSALLKSAALLAFVEMEETLKTSSSSSSAPMRLFPLVLLLLFEPDLTIGAPREVSALAASAAATAPSAMLELAVEVATAPEVAPREMPWEMSASIGDAITALWAIIRQELVT